MFKQHQLRCDPCLDYAEFVGHPQFEANKLRVRVEDPREGEVSFPSTPVRFSGFPYPEVCNHAPILGEHTKEILQNLGYSEEQISQLHEEGAVGIPTPDMFKAKRTQKGTYGKGAAYRGTGSAPSGGVAQGA